MDVGKPYVTWNVVATPALSLKPETWCFPVVGCVAYRGYFEEADARRYGQELEAEGMDVAVVGARAYSTLGWFEDPILNTILFDAEYRFAGTLFHELAHERVFVKGDTSFNESYAVAVEQFALERWLSARGDAAALEKVAERCVRQRPGRPLGEIALEPTQRGAAAQAPERERSVRSLRRAAEALPVAR